MDDADAKAARVNFLSHYASFFLRGARFGLAAGTGSATTADGSLGNLDRDVAGPLADAGDTATGAGAPALQRRPFVHVDGRDDEIVAVPVQSGVRLGIRDGRAQHLVDLDRRMARS